MESVFGNLVGFDGVFLCFNGSTDSREEQVIEILERKLSFFDQER